MLMLLMKSQRLTFSRFSLILPFLIFPTKTIYDTSTIIHCVLKENRQGIVRPGATCAHI